MASLADAVSTWNPDPATHQDLMPLGPATALHAVLDRRGRAPGGLSGAVLPTCWHWLYFLDWPAHRELGDDGHPADGRFLPPVPHRRRMFAGGRIRVHAPLRLGELAVRTRSLTNAVVKQGRSGAMLFVTIRDEVCQGGELRLVEEQTLMYRSGDPAHSDPAHSGPLHSVTAPLATLHSATQDSATAPVASADPWQRPFVGDPVRLARFSALTANAHRIHYDHPYATGVEGYPGLVVHGPLLVMLMTGLVPWRAGDGIATVDYRLRRPVFAGEAVLASGRPRDDGARAELNVLGPAGDVRASADVTFAEPARRDCASGHEDEGAPDDVGSAVGD